MIGQPGAMKLEEQPTVVNYQFLTAAGDWKVNLTNTFLALATPVYTTWEDFARKLDEVLAQFVAIYHPAYFERIGLRYINGFPAAPSVWRACRSATLSSPPILA